MTLHDEQSQRLLQKANDLRTYLEENKNQLKLKAEDCEVRMAEDESKRWDAFTPWELAAMDEFFQTFAPLRADSLDIQKIRDEIRASMQRRRINPMTPSAPETGPEVS